MKDIDIRTMKIGDLIPLFERDILYDCHKLQTRVGRSDAAKEIQRRGSEAIPDLAHHLNENMKLRPDNDEVRLGWALLLRWNRENLQDIQDLPKEPSSLNEWFAWACSKAPAKA